MKKIAVNRIWWKRKPKEKWLYERETWRKKRRKKIKTENVFFMGIEREEVKERKLSREKILRKKKDWMI